MPFVYSIQRILEIIGHDAECVGSYEGTVTGIASLSEAVEGDVSFLGNSKYLSEVSVSKASVLLLPREYSKAPQSGQMYIKVENPSFALALLCRDIEKNLHPVPEPAIHPTAYVDPKAVVSPAAFVGPFCSIGEGSVVGASVLDGHVYIGRHAKISDETHIFSQVVISDYCEIGPRNRLYPGCVIGSDGYGYEFRGGSHQRVPQIGNVVTGTDVDVGANTTIDRARFDSTFIGTGTKIDNQVQVGHNVKIGRNCLIVAQVGIGGSAILGDGVVVAGKSGVAGHITIGSGAMIAGATNVYKSLEPNVKVRGPNGDDLSLYGRMSVLQRRLPELFKRFSNLEKSIESLENFRTNR